MASVQIFLCVISMIHLSIASRGGGTDPSRRSVSPGDCLVWGPGLRSEFVVPVRYFYIQAMDQHGDNFTESVGSTAFSLSVTKADGFRMYTRTDVIDRRDGSYIGRFRLIRMSTEDLVISILYKGQHVAGSPYTLTGPVYDETCDCPQSDLQDWFSTMECDPSYPQLQQDLSIFTQPLDFGRIAQEATERFAGSISHYKVIDNKIYRKDYFGKNSISMGKFADEFLVSLARKVRLPDVEFLMNLSDWPKEKRTVTDKPLPVASWCGSNNTRDIVLPTYELIKSTIYMLERHNTDPFSVQGRTGPLWRDKTDQAFWRGRDSHRARLDLAVMAQKYPDILNVSLTSLSFHPKDEKYGPLSPHVDFFDFFQHKYQITIDGTVAAFRLPFLLASDCAILKQDSPYYEHFYGSMEPYVHYIPVKDDLSDLMNKIKWAKEHDREAEAIGRSGQELVLAHLTPAHIYCYYAKFLYEFSKLLENGPVLEKEFTLVESTDFKHDSKCNCHRKQQVKNGNSHTEL